MKKVYWAYSCLFLMIGLLGPSALSAQETPSNSSKTSSTAPSSFSPDHLQGSCALGVVASTLATDVNFRWWFENNTALDIYAGGNFSEVPNSDFNGNLIDLPNWTYSLGLGMRQNIAHPNKDVYVQLIEKATFDSSLQQQEDSIQLTYNEEQALSAYLGMGFEAFVPFWRNLSLEGSVGLQGKFIWSEYYNTFNGSITTESSNFVFTGLVANNLAGLFNVAAHFYF